MDKNSTEAESTSIAENFANWALDEATALPHTSNQTIARMTYDAVGLMYAARTRIIFFRSKNQRLKKAVAGLLAIKLN